MYVEYEYYHEQFKGSLDQNEFETLEKHASMTVQLYMEQYIAAWDLKKTINDYGVDLKDAVCCLVDFFKSLGGLTVIQSFEPSDFDIKSVKTEGFEYSFDENRMKERFIYFNGAPFSVMVANMIKKELRMNGFLKRKIK